MIFKIYIIFILVSNILFSQYLNEFKLLKINKSLQRSNSQIANNAVIDIKAIEDSLILFGTGGGLSYSRIYTDNSLAFGYYTNQNMPLGGNPSVAVNANYIAVSGVIDTTVATGIEPKGTGISYSTDGGQNWIYLSQPIDNIPESGQYHTILWGEQEISALSVTTEINNVSYDIAIHENYIYAASWAGGLRRYPIGILDNNIDRKWEIIPLPRDNDLNLYCGEIDSSYYLNPRDPSDNGYHNHKGFSIYFDEQFIWAGTAAGINKGIIDGNCINWVGHYSTFQNNISGNWVIGFTHQTFSNNTKRIWAITWNAESQGEFNGLSYSDDDGDTWSFTLPSGNPEKIYNLFSYSNQIWASSESGLYVSEDGYYWEKYNHPIDNNSLEILLSEPVTSSYYSQSLNWLWLGTADGLAISNNDGLTWDIHRFWESTQNNNHNIFSAYPNPFFINDHNQLHGTGYVRFIFYNPNQKYAKIDIFDFSMNKVINLTDIKFVNHTESEIIWNGKNDYGDKVSNGVYFCRLMINNKINWTKVAIIN